MSSHPQQTKAARQSLARRSRIALDELGEELDVRIRIAPDGRVYFHDIPLAMLGVAEALSPGDPALEQRRRMADLYRRPEP